MEACNLQYAYIVKNSKHIKLVAVVISKPATM